MPDLQEFIQQLEEQNAPDSLYVSMVRQEAKALSQLLEKNPSLLKRRVFQRLCLPDRVIEFKVSWTDDQGIPQVNRGWRVQHSNVVGPYKGGLRFHPALGLSTLKALAFEQSFKNALTGLPIGGAKGGADFNPKGRSDAEIMRFCQAFMSECYAEIGPNRDIPAGDINVGNREIGYLFGQYKTLTRQFEGAITGKAGDFGGSQGRSEATGFGVIYFVEELLKSQDETLEGKVLAISGAGNVALHAALKAIQSDARVITLSNSRGLLVAENGLTEKQINWLLEQQQQLDNSLEEAAKEFDLQYEKDSKPWQKNCDIALPCATQNELNIEDLKQLKESDCLAIVEGSNMALTDEALNAIADSDLLFGPGKAANAGGVAISTLEMTQNATFSPMTFDDVDQELQRIMQAIFKRCMDNAPEDSDKPDLHKGASIAGFKILSAALLAQQG
ncbi:NADP-specific glutamate dehydrogenase [Planctobacterium marinum]|uniref:Glutamate dehydrogenase n=1 Tax=Planctobacterium marinum TaxID=1631968 RepID=A0AA48KV20_9ALTE|nr:glutamate dehydrogenase [Planctobacterium marinum]